MWDRSHYETITSDDLGRVADYFESSDIHEISMHSDCEVATVPDMGESGALVDGFDKWLQAGGVGAGTRKIRRSHVARFALAAGSLADATADDVTVFLGRPDWAPQTRRSALASLRVFYEWATTSGVLASNPTLSARGIKVPRGLPRPAPVEAIDKALANATDEERVALLLALLAGLRRAEVRDLLVADIGEGWLRIVGKGNVARRVPLHPDLVEPLALQCAKATARGSEYVFYSPRYPSMRRGLKWIDSVVSPLLGPDVTFHQLRHSFGTNAYRGTRDIRAVQRLLGHANISTTERYVDVADDALVSAVQQLSPPPPERGAARGSPERVR